MQFLRAAVPILRDMLSTILFVALFWVTDNISLATGFGIALGLSQAIWMKWRRHPIGPLQWLSLALISVLGATTILTRNPHFVMMKPTLLWLALGAVMLRRDWMAPYLPPIVTDNLDDRLIVRAGYAWAALMFVLAAMNTLVTFVMSAKFWSVYALAAPSASFPALFAAQYLMFRKLVLARIKARRQAQIA
jgi:intracellular septation protein A